MLQAVHLLLAFKLFVVVVGVDPRWLLHSLTQHSTAFQDAGAGDANGLSHWRSTPLNYLEKTLLVRRGVLRASHVRRPTVTLDPDSQAYADLLVERMLAVVADLPAPSAAGRPAGP